VKEKEPMGNRGTVSIIILNFNGRAWLGECLQSLRELDFPKEKLEIILGDNASTDGSIGFVSGHYPEVRIVPFDQNYGFCKPNNVCARAAQGEFFVFLNNDTFVTRDWLKSLVASAVSDPQVVACASKIFFPPAGNKVLNAAGGVFLCSGSGAYDGWMTEDAGQFEKPRDTGFGCAAGVLVRKDFFLETGGFDEYFFYSSEEMDLGFRAWVRGKKVSYVPSAALYHHMGKTGFREKGVTPAIEFLISRNHLYFMLKNFEGRTLLKGFCLYEARILLKMIYATVHGRFKIVLAILKAQAWILRDLPRIFKARQAAQKERRVSDKQLAAQGLLLGFWATIQRNREMFRAIRKHGGKNFYDQKENVQIRRTPHGEMFFFAN